MWLSDDEDFKTKSKRVVFMEKCGKYIAWANAETIEESENFFGTTAWNFAKNIEPETVELTMDEIAEKFGISVENLKIKK